MSSQTDRIPAHESQDDNPEKSIEVIYLFEWGFCIVEIWRLTPWHGMSSLDGIYGRGDSYREVRYE